MTNEELLEKIDQRFLIEREETRKIVQQEARKIVKEEVKLVFNEEGRKIIQEETRAIFNEQGRKIVQEETRAIFNEQGRKIVQEEINKETEPIKVYLKRLDKRSLKTNKTLHLIARVYNQEDVKLKKRVNNIEEYLGIPNPTIM
jgi:hypothetical protein